MKRATARKTVQKRGPVKKVAKRAPARKAAKGTVRKIVKRVPAKKAAKRITKRVAVPAKKIASRRWAKPMAFSKLTPTQKRQIRLDLKAPSGWISNAAVAEWKKR